jgi:hypothetical protein
MYKKRQVESRSRGTLFSTQSARGSKLPLAVADEFPMQIMGYQYAYLNNLCPYRPVTCVTSHCCVIFTPTFKRTCREFPEIKEQKN